MQPGLEIRNERDDEWSLVAAVTREAFGPEDDVVAQLPAALTAHHLSREGRSLVAVTDADELVGHVQLSRCWIDDEQRLVSGLTLSPLSVLPAHQRQGVGGELVAAALRAADEAGEPFVMLEGAPGLYRQWGFEPAADHAISPPSTRIPAPACQVALLGSWDSAVTGALVYNDVFWTHDAVGLRGAVLQQVRAALGD